MEFVHNRLYRLESQWYWEEEPISTEEGESLRDHYFKVRDDLARPWLTKDDEPEIIEEEVTAKTVGRKGVPRRYDVSHRPPPKRIY